MYWNDPNNSGEPGNYRQGFGDYLQTQGWDGQGPMWQYAQQLRQQGQHPRMDYRQSLGGGLGGLASGFGQNQMPGTDAFGPRQNMHGPQGSWSAQGAAWNQPPHTMTPGLPSYQGPNMQHQGIAVGEPNGLAGLAKMRPNKLQPR